MRRAHSWSRRWARRASCDEAQEAPRRGAAPDDAGVGLGLGSGFRKGCRAQGAQLEPALGSARFLRLVAELLLTTQALAVLLARAGAAALPDLLGPQYRSSCAVGFSGVLFALKARTARGLLGSAHMLVF